MDGWRRGWGSEAAVFPGGGEGQGQGQVTLLSPGVMESGSPELGQASGSLDGRAVRRGPPGGLCSPCWGLGVERGGAGGAGGTGKVFEEQKQ